MEHAIVAWFMVELCLRLHAAPADPHYRSRLGYLFSVCGLVDLASTVPFYIARCSGSGWPPLDALASLADEHDEELGLCRVLRLLLLSNQSPSMGIIVRVFKNPKIRRDLLMALYVSVTCLLLFSTLLHLTESHDAAHKEMASRFRSILSSMPFTLVHLTGDYPLVDYTVPARFVHTLMLMAAQGMVGVVGGIVASGFVQELKEHRASEHRRRHHAAGVLGPTVRGWLQRRRWATMHNALKLLQATERRKLVAAQRHSSFMWRVRSALNNRTWRKVQVVLIVLNALAVLAESVPSAHAAIGHAALDNFELMSVLVFTAEYIARFYAAPVKKGYDWSRRTFVFSFFGVVDLLAILPYWIQVAFSFEGVEYDFFLFRITRSLRVFQLEDFVPSFTLLDDAWYKCKDTVKASALLALVIWVLGAVLFFEFEKDNEALGGAFDSIPSALHHCAIFLAGDWAEVDFTPLGKCLCMLYCMLGMAIFAIPVGSFFEAFEAALSPDNEG